MAKTIYVGKKCDNYIIIRCNVSGQDTSILISSADPISSSSSSTITTNPLVTGDYIADHMFVQPKSLTVRGTLSINDGVSGNFSSRISEFQKLVEKIKNEAIKCDIATIRSSSSRFVPYGSMVLNSITFTEDTNNLDFTLGFQQILMTDVTVKPYDKSDPWLPTVDPAQSLSFTQEYFDWAAATKYVIQYCIESNIVDQNIVNEAYEKVKQDEAIAGLGTLVGVGGIVGMLAASGPVGWTIGLGALVVGGITFAVSALAAESAKSEASAAYENLSETNKALFEYTDDMEKNEQTEKDFIGFVSNVAKRLLQLNNQILVYQVDLIDDTEVYASINNDYYIFNFRRSSNGWLMDLYDVNGNLLKGNTVVRDGLLDFSQVNSSTSFYKKGNVRFYMFMDVQKSGVMSARVLAYIGNPDEFQKEMKEIIRSAFNERVIG